ncbi:MAG TPA: ABC transporter permease [Gemmatimonadales bacterium]|nr:ABC transporter permease [Gemmatimonadales bacterium]
METLFADLRYAIRSLRNSPGFTVVAVLTLGLGIGANAAIFSVVNGVLLAPLPYRDPGQLVTVNHFYPSLNNLRAPVSVPGFRDYSARTDLFSSAAVENGRNMNLTGSGDPERVSVTQVTGQFFPLLGVAPALGRALQPDESQPGKNHVAVLSWGFWRRKFGGDRNVLDQHLVLDNESYQIVGVMPPTFQDFFSRRTDVFTPLYFEPAAFADNRRTNEFLPFIGRLAPGVTLERAQSAMHALAAQLRTQYAAQYSPDWDLTVTALSDDAAQNVRSGLLILLGAVALVLLIACANVANLQLARSAARARDVAVRVALGASPRRLMRLLLTESFVLALAGGGLGILLAVWGVPALLTLNGDHLPATAHIAVSLPVLGFALAVSLATGFLFGLAPALQMARTDLHETLKEGGRGAVSQRGSLTLRRGLVVSTVALALTLLVGAGLLIRSFSRILGVDPGFRPDHLLTFSISLPRAKYANDTVRTQALERIADALAATPGVVAAGGTTVIPFGGSWSTSSFNVEGFQVPVNAPGPWGDVRLVTPGFLPAMGARLVAGRQFTDADRAGAAAVCIVDEEMVRRYWPHTDPIGKRITFNNLTDSAVTWIQVVGVVGHMAHEGLDAPRRVQVYFPLAQTGNANLVYAVRTSGPPLAALSAARNAVRSVDPDLPLAATTDMEQMIDGSLGARRFAMLLLGGFALLAMILASVGLYGVMSYTVTQRAREMGVRLALGADTGDVLGLVLKQGVNLTLVGVVIGIGAAALLTRVMKTMLYDVGTTDPLTFVTIPFVLLAVALLATYLPARRATRTDPIVALRAE